MFSISSASVRIIEYMLAEVVTKIRMGVNGLRDVNHFLAINLILNFQMNTLLLSFNNRPRPQRAGLCLISAKQRQRALLVKLIEIERIKGDKHR